MTCVRLERLETGIERYQDTDSNGARPCRNARELVDITVCRAAGFCLGRGFCGGIAKILIDRGRSQMGLHPG